MGRTGNRIFRDPDRWCEEPGDEIKMREIRYCSYDDPTRWNCRECNHIGFKGAEIYC